jgi:AraC-like DNA-binding protein
MDALAIDPALLTMFNVVQTSDPGTPDGTIRVTERTAEPRCFYKYQLQDRALWPMQFESPIFSIATRNAGSILATYVGNRFATEISIDGEDGDLFCFTAPLHGKTTLVDSGDSTTTTESCGLAFRPGPGARLQISDNNARTNVFLKVAEVEDALERTLDEHLRRPLKFRPNLDWSSGLAASLKFQLDFVMHEFQRSDGVASNPVALASMTDLVISLALRGAPHNYSDRLDRSSAGAVPAYIRRAEDFMRAHCAEPIRMVHVAAAAGCGVGTLGAVFRHFRGKTPLGVLHAIRLEQAHCELTRGGTGASVATVARRYGFTNPARFTVAFRRRFGETPSEVVRRASRS